MKSWKFIVFATLFGAVLGYIINLMQVHHRSHHCPDDTAQLLVNDIAAAIIVYRMEEGEFPLPRYATPETRMSSILSTLFTNSYLSFSPAANMALDPWANQCNVHIRGITIESDEYDEIFGKDSGDVTVWSSGRNGINQQGRGDDIVDCYSKHYRNNERLAWSLP
jgi:hypothetical protein